MPTRLSAPQSARARTASPIDANTATLSQDVSAPAAAPVLDAEQTDTERLSRLLAEFDGGEGFTARLERVRMPGTAAELCGYLGTLPFSDEFLEDVRAEHGGGRFRARIYDGKNDYRVSFSFAIAGAAKRPGESTAAPVGVGPASAETSKLEKMIAELAGAVAGMAAAMQRAPKTEDELDRFVSIARAIREINPPAPIAAAGDGLSTLETFFRLQDMLDERAPRGGGSDNIGRIVEHGVKPIAGLLGRSLDLQERAMQLRANNGARRLSAPVAVTPVGTPAPIAGDVAHDVPDVPLSGAEQAEHAGAVDAIAQLATTIPVMARSYLANQAKHDRDPETYAVMALDTISESAPDTYAQLPELLQRADFTPALLDAIPQWGMYPEWFGELVDAMRAQLTDSEQGDAGADAAGEAAA